MKPLCFPPSGHWRDAALLTATLCLSLPVALVAAKPSKEELRAAKREGVSEDSTAKPKKREDPAESRVGKTSPADAQARQLERLREKLEIQDDTEWSLIAERIAKVEEVRRTLWAVPGGPRPAATGSEKNKRSGPGGNAERDALRAAVSDKLPDAEIKSRLSRAHEIQVQNESRLQQAQADLRAVLTIRQEAIVVMAGLLPP